jgi:cell division protein FtsQ
MKSKKKITWFFVLLFSIAAVTGTLLLASFNAAKQKNEKCYALEITFHNTDQMHFLDDTDVEEIILNTMHDSLKGHVISGIQLEELEQALEKNAYVKDAESYLDMQGTLHITIAQKQPVARVINKFGVHYYLTEEGQKFPLNNKFTCRVPVISGNVSEGIAEQTYVETEILQQAFAIVRFIRADALWNAQVEQIFVTDANTFELVPMVGEFVIELGDANNLEKKFSNLANFYTQGLNYIGWGNYKTVNASILNQIYCTKKDTL